MCNSAFVTQELDGVARARWWPAFRVVKDACPQGLKLTTDNSAVAHGYQRVAAYMSKGLHKVVSHKWCALADTHVNWSIWMFPGRLGYRLGRVRFSAFIRISMTETTTSRSVLQLITQDERMGRQHACQLCSGAQTTLDIRIQTKLVNDCARHDRCSLCFVAPSRTDKNKCATEQR